MNTDEIVRALCHRADAANKRGYSGEASEWLELADLIESLQAETFGLKDIAGRYEQLTANYRKLMEEADNLEIQLVASQARERAAVEAVKQRIGFLEKLKAKSLADQVNKDGVLALLDGLLVEIVGPQEAGEGGQDAKD